MLKKLFTFLFIAFISAAAHAQTWEVGLSGGTAGYIGDLNPRQIFQVSGPSFGAFVKRNISPYAAIRLQYMHGRIAAADSSSQYPDNYNRNLSFKTTLDEGSLIGEFNFFKYRPSVDHNTYTPYVFLGVGMVSYNPTAVYQGGRYDLRPLTTEGQIKQYSKTAITIPYGIGFKYNIVGKLSLIADVGYRSTNTDYLDDVSGNYADKIKLPGVVAVALSDRTGERTGGINVGGAGSQRGDLRAHDNYMFFSLSVAFTFVTPKCYFER